MDDTQPVWKKIYQTLSIESADIELSVIDTTLDICKNKLLTALLDFKPYSKESFKIWLEKSLLAPSGEDDIRSFINQLSIELDLDVNICWTLMFNFLMFEYYGKVDELKSIIRYESNAVALIEHIWIFYTSERMFVLKILRHIFAKAQDKGHILYNRFNAFIKSIDIQEFWNNLNQIFDNLYTELHRKKHTTIVQRNVEIARWAHRNNREQVEIVLLMIDVLNYYELKPEDFETTVTRFIRHNFGRTALYDPVNYTTNEEIVQDSVQDIQEAEIGCLLAMAYQILEKPQIFTTISSQLEKCLISEIKYVDYSAVLLIWTLLKVNFDKNEDYYKEKLILILEQENHHIFEFLYKVLSSYVLSCDFLPEVTHQATYKLFKVLTEYISTDSQIVLFQQRKFPDILAALIKYRFLRLDDRLFEDFVCLALKTFPYQVAALGCIFKEIIKLPHCFKKSVALLNNMTTYLDNNSWKCQLYAHSDEYETDVDVELFDGFIIEKGCKLEKFPIDFYDATLYHVNYKFYAILEKLMHLLLVKVKRGAGFYDDKLATNIIHGFDMIIEIINNYEGLIKYDEDLLKCVSSLDSIPKYFTEEPFYSRELILIYFRVKIALLKTNQLKLNDVIPSRVQKLLLPQLNLEKYSQTEVHSFEIKSTSILHTFITKEETGTDHSLLYNYMQLVLYAFENGKYKTEIQKPGLVYLTFYVFPHYAQWRYKDMHQRNLIIKTYYKILTCVVGKNPYYFPNVDCEMFFKYLNLFLNEQWAINTFDNYFTCQKFYLNYLMEDDVNWGPNGRAALKLEVFKLQLSLLILFTKYKLHMDRKKQYVFDVHIFNFCKGVTPFMITPYDTSLAVLSLQFLNVLANDVNAPVMALLGLDYDQTQRIFLERLRDPMENEKIKIHILELITTCVLYQHGLTAAVFNVEWTKKWYDPLTHKLKVNDSMGDFIEEYLINLEKSHTFLQNTQQILILKIMCNLWVAHKQKLLKKLIKSNTFWSGLFSPLFHDFNLSVKVYIYIFRIINLQLLRPVEESPHFPDEIQKFVNNKEQLRKFNEYIVNLFENSPSDQEEISFINLLLKYWTEFLVHSQKCLKTLYNDDELKYIIINAPLNAIQVIVDNNYLPQWIDLLFIVMRNWNDYKYTGKEKDFDENLKQSLRILNKFYIYYPLRLRDSIISIYRAVIISLKSYYEKNVSDLLELLKLFGSIIDHEYKEFKQIDWKSVETHPESNSEKLIPWMLIINTVNEILKMECVHEFSIWFKYHNYLQCLFKIVPKLMHCKTTLKLAKMVIHSLTLYMKTKMAFDVGNISIINFYDSIEPPLRDIIDKYQLKNEPMKLKELFITISVIMRFNQTIINHFKLFSIKNIFCFLFLHEFIINYIISLPQYTVDLNALDLLITTLCFIDDVLLYGNEDLYKNAHLTYFSILSSIKTVVNSCITAILRPKNLTFYELDEYGNCVLTRIPSDILAVVVNKLITVISVGCSCLYKINADYISLLHVTMPSDIIYIMVEADFNVPKFDETLPDNLTYSRLLCLGHFLCKTLSQLQSQSGTGLQIDKTDDITRYIGLIEHFSSDQLAQNEKLSSFLRYGLYEYSGLTDPWIKKLDLKTVKCGLEMLFVFLSIQVYLTVGATKQSTFQFRRSLLSELQFLHDYVKKRANEYLSQQTDFHKFSNDVLMNFQLCLKRNHEFERLTDEHFLTVLSQFFTHVCGLNEISLFY